MTRIARILRLFTATLLLTVSLAACGEQVELVGRLGEQEANEILETLLSSGIDARKVPGTEGTMNITVESASVAAALQIMRANGLPRETFAQMGDIFAKEGLISSPLEERARYLYALSQELAGTISQIDGVVTARVHVVLPDRAPGSGDALTPSSAAVFIKYKEVYDIETVVPQIKRLVTNSIPDLRYENVSVVLVPSMVLAPVSTTPATVPVLGLEVAPHSRGAVIAGVAGLLFLAMLGAGAAGAMYWMWQIKPRRKQIEAADG